MALNPFTAPATPEKRPLPGDCPVCGAQDVPIKSGRVGQHHPIHVVRANDHDGRPVPRYVPKLDVWCTGVGELPERPSRRRKAAA